MSTAIAPAELRTERDVIETLAGRTVTLDEIYDGCRDARITDRDDGHAPIAGHGGDTVWRRRVRNTLQSLRRQGRAERVGPGQWIIDGSRSRPERSLLIVSGDVHDFELVLADAATTIRTSDEPFDLVVTDPPWALEVTSLPDSGVDRIEHAYVRDSSKVVDGYHEVPAHQYREFTERWIAAAAGAIRPGGYLAVITGPTGAARVQCAAEDAGLTFMNSISVRRPFAMRTTRKFAHSHTVVTILHAGPYTSPDRYFTAPADLPKAASGRSYPLDVWTDVPKFERPGLVRYPCGGLHPVIVRRIVHALTRGPEAGYAPWHDRICDPFLGGGTTATVALDEQRRFRGGDLNPNSLRFTMARLAAEHPPARRRTLALGAGT
jgi:DNA modification methylase